MGVNAVIILMIIVAIVSDKIMRLLVGCTAAGMRIRSFRGSLSFKIARRDIWSRSMFGVDGVCIPLKMQSG